MSVSEFLRDAEEYVGHGWSIIPIRYDRNTGKKPAACKWEEYQRRRPTPDELMRMFRLRGLTGLAVVLGLVSTGLYARDFDVPEGYHQWAEAFPELAGRMPTYQTGRVFQVLGYHSDEVQTRDLGDGELRGEGAYSVLPRSLHPTGVRYAWKVGGPVYESRFLPQRRGWRGPGLIIRRMGNRGSRGFRGVRGIRRGGGRGHQT